MGYFHPSFAKVVQVSPGEHLIEATTTDGAATIQTKVKVDQGQKAVDLRLKREDYQQLKIQRAETAAEPAGADAALNPTWTDPATGLTWAGKDNGLDVNWHQANTYCSNLQLDGLSGWRLPTIEELHGIYDPSVNSHAKWDDEVRNDMHVKGNLRLSGWSWSSSFHRSSSQAKEHPISEAGVFAFTHEDPKGGGFPFDFSYNTRALCVRDSGDGKSAQVLTKGGQGSAFEAWDSTNAPQ
jgi:hypothetical protein